MLKTISIAALVTVAACNKTEPTATRGDLMIFSTESIAPLVASAGREFGRLYDRVSVTVHATSTREAIVHLLNDSVTAVAVDRPLNTEEQQIASRLQDPITATVWGADALVVIVNTDNPLVGMTSRTLNAILAGQARSWSNVPGSGSRASVDLVITGRNSGSYELLTDHFFDLPSPPAAASFESDERAVIRRVARETNAVGIVSFSTLNSLRDADQEISAVRRIILDEITVSQQSIHDETYLLRYKVYLLTKERKAGPAAGFATFLAGIHGQTIVQKAGIVPATIPSRVIQLTQEE